MRGASCLGQACATWASSPWYLQGKGHCMVIIPACRNLDLAPASAAFPRSALGCCLCGVCGGISAWPVPSLGGHCSLVCAAVGANCWWGNSLVRSITDTSPLTGVIELSPPRPKVLYRAALFALLGKLRHRAMLVLMPKPDRLCQRGRG